MIKTLRRTILALATVALAFTLPAAADTLNLTLTNPLAIAVPGSTLTFDATVTAPLSNTGTVFLNGDTLNLSLAGATLDDSPFLFNFPFSLNPGDTFTGDLFTVTIPSTIAQGLYNGSFEILGGSDFSSQDIIGSANFQVAATPEPSTWLLLSTGIVFVAVGVTRRRSLVVNPVATN